MPLTLDINKDESNKRLKDIVVSKPIIYGSIAFYLGKKAEETKTHRWHIYVRGVNGEDLSYMISKVSFTLHQSFSNPVRVIKNPPFEVSEYGWGEFDSKIQIYFQDSLETPIEFYHFLKLYPPLNQPTTTKKPVLNEYYDELVFNQPTKSFYRKLMDGPEKKIIDHSLNEYFPIYSELPDIQLMNRASKWVNDEINILKKRLIKSEIDYKYKKTELSQLQLIKKQQKQQQQKQQKELDQKEKSLKSKESELNEDKTMKKENSKPSLSLPSQSKLKQEQKAS